MLLQRSQPVHTQQIDFFAGAIESSQRQERLQRQRKGLYAEARAGIFKDELDKAPAPPLVQAPRRTTPPSSYHYVIHNNYVIPTPQEQQTPQDSQRPSSKATWRNQRQEVNDPDFQRGGSMVVPQSYENYYNPTTTMTSAAANPYYAASAAAAASQDYYGGGAASA
jgi:hypothetical protein